MRGLCGSSCASAGNRRAPIAPGPWSWRGRYSRCGDSRSLESSRSSGTRTTSCRYGCVCVISGLPAPDGRRRSPGHIHYPALSRPECTSSPQNALSPQHAPLGRPERLVLVVYTRRTWGAIVPGYRDRRSAPRHNGGYTGSQKTARPTPRGAASYLFVAEYYCRRAKDFFPPAIRGRSANQTGPDNIICHGPAHHLRPGSENPRCIVEA